MKKSHLDKVSHPRFNQTFIIGKLPVVLHPLEIVSVPRDQLGKRVDSLTDDGDRIIDAPNELMTRAHG